MSIPAVLIAAALLCMVWNVLTTVRTSIALEKRGEKTNFFLLRLMAPIYAHRLAKLKQSETGGSGSLFYQWILSANLALVLAIAALVVHLA